jgi:GLPGLI family protein
MKTIIITIAALAIAACGSAQNAKPLTLQAGKIQYVEKTKFEIAKVEGLSDEMMAAFPKEQVAHKMLYFNTEASLYTKDKTQDNNTSVTNESEGMAVKIYMEEPDDKSYCDLKTMKNFEEREFMTRRFLIESDQSKKEWKLTGNQKTVLDYPCQEAVLQDGDRKITAWFTPMIPVSSGPANFGNLPGLILAADINDGKTTITATSIDPTTPDKSLIVKPKDGKKVTRAEFEKIRDEKMKEMGGSTNGGSHVIVRVQQ